MRLVVWHGDIICAQNVLQDSILEIGLFNLLPESHLVTELEKLILERFDVVLLSFPVISRSCQKSREVRMKGNKRERGWMAICE